MKTFDTEKAKRFIEKFKPQLAGVSGGLMEDWFWTGATIWTKESEEIDCEGVYKSSSWATPVLSVITNDGKEFFVFCFTGESDRERESSAMLGCLSGPVQSHISEMQLVEWNEGELFLLPETSDQ